jgi:hypothetical protein
MFDVLNQALPVQMPNVVKSIRNALVPGGVFAIREPALAFASGRHDREVSIRKRFDKPFLRELLEQAGFEIASMTYLNTILFAPIVVIRKIGVALSRDPKSDVQETNVALNALLLGVLRFERILLRATSLPFGVSILAIARRR